MKEIASTLSLFALHAYRDDIARALFDLARDLISDRLPEPASVRAAMGLALGQETHATTVSGINTRAFGARLCLELSRVMSLQIAPRSHHRNTHGYTMATPMILSSVAQGTSDFHACLDCEFVSSGETGHTIVLPDGLVHYTVYETTPEQPRIYIQLTRGTNIKTSMAISRREALEQTARLLGAPADQIISA